MNMIRILLFPFVPVYWLLIEVRNFLFDKSVFKSQKVNATVISVGNITTGGSGKTPATIFLTEMLKNEGKKVGVLSRGYGRNSKGYIFVSDGNKILTSVEKSGDEIYHTVLDCKVPAAVCENRVKGAEKLIEQTGIDTVVLDDAFQHRWISRKVDIVLMDQRFLVEENSLSKILLPVGSLRESFKSLKRANAIILNRKFMDSKPIPSKYKKQIAQRPVFHAYYKAISFIDLKSKAEYSLDEFKGQKSLVVSGIANPKSFLNVLLQTSLDTSNKLIFGDHKNYTGKDIQQIRKKFYSTNSHSVVTTEKDAVKLSKYSIELDDIDIYYLKIKMKMDDENSFKEFILKSIN
jgi:tetraacyldisaccharide 4'-kinase